MDVILFNQFFSCAKDNPSNYLAIVPQNLLYLANYLKMKGMSVYGWGVLIRGSGLFIPACISRENPLPEVLMR